MLHLVSSHKPASSGRIAGMPRAPTPRAAPTGRLPLLRGLLLLSVVYLLLWFASTH